MATSTYSFAKLKKCIQTKRCDVHSALDLLKVQRKGFELGKRVNYSLDEILSADGKFTARELIFAYYIANNKVGNRKRTSVYSCAKRAGFANSDADILLKDKAIQGKIKEFQHQMLEYSKFPDDDLRELALQKLAGAASITPADLLEYSDTRALIPTSMDSGEELESASAGEAIVNALSDGAEPLSGDEDLEEISEDTVALGIPVQTGGVGGRAKNGYYGGYIQLADGSTVRIRGLDELPENVAAGIKKISFHSVGMIKGEDGVKRPIMIPDIELHDGVRAAELLLKYTGDIGSKKGDDTGQIDASVVKTINAAFTAMKLNPLEGETVEVEFTEPSEPDNAEG